MSKSQASVINLLLDRVENLRAEGKNDDAFRVSSTAVESARRAVEESDESRPFLITALEVCADLYREAGDYPSAEGLYIEALGWAETCEIPPGQLGRLTSSLAGVYDFAGLKESAIPLYEQSIEIFASCDPPLEIDVANLRNNLGMLYKEIGNFDLAEEHYIKALAIFEQNCGRDSDDVAALYNNLGGLYYASGYSAQAREMHSQALEIRQKICESPDHPDLGQSLSNLATVLHELGEDEEAARNYESALRILETNVQRDGETFSIVCDNFATLMRKLGRERKAASIERKAVKLLRRRV
jgi:tetratricopeptide (TPR) repeat protein